MRHPVNADVKSICDEIVSQSRTWEEWLQGGRQTFFRRTCMCAFDPRHLRRGAFCFFLSDAGEWTGVAEPLSLDDVGRMSAGEVRDIPLHPFRRAAPPPGMRRVELDPDTVAIAMNDAINVYIRDVLIPRGVVNKELYDGDMRLIELKHQVAEYWAYRWRESWVRDSDDAAGDT